LKNRNIAYAGAALVIVLICCGLLLACSIYGFPLIGAWFDRLNAWAVEGEGTPCFASAFVPLSIGLILWKGRGKRG
jgi:hypothetical protein